MRRVIAIFLLLALLLAAAFLLFRPPDVNGPAPRPPDPGPPGRGTTVAAVDPVDPVDLVAADGPTGGASQARFSPRRPGDVPEEQRGRGDCTLNVRFFDDHQNVAVAQRVVLWRLDVPQTGRWGAGDHIHRSGLDVPAAGLDVEGLPEGRYRFECPGLRKGAPDPPDFLVAGERTLLELRLPVPRSVPVRLLLFDVKGERVERARIGLGNVRWVDPVSSATAPPPGWARPRLHLHRFYRYGRRLRAESPVGEVLPRAKREPVRVGPDGFDLGTLNERSRKRGEARIIVVRPDDHCVVVCRIDSDRLDRLPFVAVTMPPDVLVRNVVLDDGTQLADVTYWVTATGNAVLLAGRDPAGLWPRVPVTVGIAAKDYYPPCFTFDRRPADRELRTVIPRAALDRLRR